MDWIQATDWARLAAYLDGEGYIAIHMKNSRSHHMMISIGNTDKRLIDWLKETFGGFVREDQQTSRRKRYWVWWLNGRNALPVLQGCLPWFIMKRDQAEVAIEYQRNVAGCENVYVNGRTRRFVSEDDRNERDRLMRRLREVRQESCELIG